MLQPLNISFLLTDAGKHGRRVSYTFLQNLRSFKRFSILEENCGANIINGTLTLYVRFLLTNAAKNSYCIINGTF